MAEASTDPPCRGKARRRDQRSRWRWKKAAPTGACSSTSCTPPGIDERSEDGPALRLVAEQTLEGTVVEIQPQAGDADRCLVRHRQAEVVERVPHPGHHHMTEQGDAEMAHWRLRLGQEEFRHDRSSPPVRPGQDGGDGVHLQAAEPHQKNHQYFVTGREEVVVGCWADGLETGADIAQSGG